MTEVELRVDDRPLDLDTVHNARPEDVSIEPTRPVGAVAALEALRDDLVAFPSAMKEATHR